jgi:hypothetical protein
MLQISGSGTRLWRFVFGVDRKLPLPLQHSTCHASISRPQTEVVMEGVARATRRRPCSGFRVRCSVLTGTSMFRNNSSQSDARRKAPGLKVDPPLLFPASLALLETYLMHHMENDCFRGFMGYHLSGARALPSRFSLGLFALVVSTTGTCCSHFLGVKMPLGVFSPLGVAGLALASTFTGKCVTAAAAMTAPPA